ncbi:FAD-binding domain-containing protein 33 [Elsinoe fawcettii]|nr:FAD-binding domain-containing protein 33 [Elsinoe fawcettii]
MFEKSRRLQERGAGIVVGPSIRNLLRELGIEDTELDKVLEVQQVYKLLHASTGELLGLRQGPEWAQGHFEGHWHHASRKCLHGLLVEKAPSMGIEVHTGCDVVAIKSEASGNVVTLEDGREVVADLIIGADGIGSRLRSWLGDVKPSATGDVAYRLLLGRKIIEDRQTMHESLREVLRMPSEALAWLGPNRHAMFYPLPGGTLFNLVVLCPDTLKENEYRAYGNIEELKTQIAGWDPYLRNLVDCVEGSDVEKLKIQHLDPYDFEAFYRENVVLVGDACHATLPYQGHGATMAIEGAMLLSTLLSKCDGSTASLQHALRLYSDEQRSRARLQLKGALSNRELFHLTDAKDCAERAAYLRKTLSSTQSVTCDTSTNTSALSWTFGNMDYSKALYHYDARKVALVLSAKDAFL